MKKTALVPIAPGSEEMEAVIIIDVLVRAGVDVTVVSCDPEQQLQITASRGVKLVADKLMDQVIPDTFDLIALPGGMPGAEHLSNNKALIAKLHQQLNHERWTGAICASPAVVLQPNDLLLDAPATCHPAFHSRIPAAQLRAEQAVVVCHTRRLVTSQGPGTAMAFALTLVECLLGRAVRADVAGPMCVSGE